MSFQLPNPIVIVGCGVAGLTTALKIAESLPVCLIAKSEFSKAASAYAQGGIAIPIDYADSIEQHVEDTFVAGDMLGDKKIIRHVIENAQSALSFMLTKGVVFDYEKSSSNQFGLHLTQEGGHKCRRIVHHKDKTGSAIHSQLLAQVKEHHNIQLKEEMTVVDILQSDNTAIGVILFDHNTQQLSTLFSSSVVLATGGASQIYPFSSTPKSANGDGIAMAYRSGCVIANLEFNQFHPTCFYEPEKVHLFLLTEALRGEKAFLTRADGSRFMLDYDQRAELAPRDVVARSIYFEMQKLKVSHLFLDISHQPETLIKNHFPNIYQYCFQRGFDLCHQAVPIVPAAHYTCGGVVVDRDGRTNIKRLYAIGETSNTGLHGANRLASNSLLECIVYGACVAKFILENTIDLPRYDIHLPNLHNKTEMDNLLCHSMMEQIKQCMWENVGIVRSNASLSKAEHVIHELKQQIDTLFFQYRITQNTIALRNCATVSWLMVQCAQQRQESRGLHYTTDFPNKASINKDSLVSL